jgi:hypothetical protein
MWRVGEPNEEYIARIEDVLKTYEKPLSESEPIVCIDEKPTVLHEDTRPVIPMQPGQVDPLDPTVIALAASVDPARHATAIEPVQALGTE